MENKEGSQRSTKHLPEFKHNRIFSNTSTKDSERGTTERARDRGHLKSVTMAPTSCYLTDRRYVMRRPLFSSEQHTSILKKTHPQKHTEKETHMGVDRGEENQQHTGMNFLTRSRADLTPDSISLSLSDISSASAARENSPMTASELRASLCREEHTFQSPFPAHRSAQQSLSSSILEVQRLNTPLRPPLTSTVLYPTYTPRSGSSRPHQTQLRFGEREGGGGGETKLCTSGGHSKGHPVSPYQANYWACAIPKSLPPSPDRHSAGWNPNREYQALLDYTYPLRPGQVVTEWDDSEHQEDSSKQKPNLQDSGIELDHLCSSTSLSSLGLSGTKRSRDRSCPGVGHRSPDLHGFTKSSDGLPSSIVTDPVDLSLESLDTSENPGGMNTYKTDAHHHHHHHHLHQPCALFPSTSTAFIRSTSVLPQSKCVCGEVDEEFWPLPEQLEELQCLSRQVREVTAQLSRPVTASWESLGPDSTSFRSSMTLPEKQESEDKKEEPEVKELGAADHRESEAVSFGAWVEPVVEGKSRSDLQEVEALVEQLCSLTLPGSQRSNQENQQQSDSLMQRIQVFCSQLEQLIQQLYSVSEKMKLLGAPTMGVDNMKLSLAEYQNFQREVSSHQPLTSCVLHTGQLLLSCINAMSPFLGDTLRLIERQSGALETHSEVFFSSILSAMDSQTHPKPVLQNRKEDPGAVGGVHLVSNLLNT